MSDAQDRAEATDDDKLGGEFPPERPLGAHRRQDDAIPESFAGREARLEPEVGQAAGTGEETVAVGDDAVAPDDAPVETPEAAEEAALHVTDEPG
jgi:hypothetical protein